MSNKLCRVSSEKLINVVDFGMHPLGNGFITESQIDNEYYFPMQLGFSEKSMMLQLIEQPEPEVMFHDHYAFFSSTSKYMIEHFRDFSNSILNSDFLSKQDPFVVELGCNDGIMLKNFSQKNIRHLGIEPSLNVAKEANKFGVKTISKFFNVNLAEEIVQKNGQADAFFAANVMCHIPDIKGVVAGIKKLLKPTGKVLFEDPYLGDIITKTSYDQIYDEHVFLFSGLSIKYLFSLYDMELIDMIPQKTHGGSMRYVLAHKNSYPVKESVNFYLNKEKDLGLDKIKTFENFNSNIKKSKNDLIALLRSLKEQGKRVAGYAATSKSTTILNYCNIGTEYIEYICDTTPIKQGTLSPGKHIPIVPHEVFKKNPPDYMFLFAWNHAEEIMAKESNYSSLGGKWITHVPEVKVF